MTNTEEIKNVVLVHGAFADGSGWRRVYDLLTARGYRVSIVQNPLTSFADDVAATNRVLDLPGWPVDPRRPLVGRHRHHRGGCTPEGRRPGLRVCAHPGCRRDQRAAVRGLRTDTRVRHRHRRRRLRLPQPRRLPRRVSPPTSTTLTPRSCATAQVPVNMAVFGEAGHGSRMARQAELGGHRHRGQGVRPGDAAAHGHAASAPRSPMSPAATPCSSRRPRPSPT